VGRPAALALYRGKLVLALTPWLAAADFALIWIIYGFSPGFDGKFACVAGLSAVAYACSGFVFLWQWHHLASIHRLNI
jgi:hypothetical protein